MNEEFRYIKRAEIKPDHQWPGAAEKILIDNLGAHQFPQFIRLQIARNGAIGGYYLFHISAHGSGTDTWHGTIEEALDAAEAEYGVSRGDWQDFD